MSNIFLFFHKNFVKYLHLGLKSKYPYIGLGFTNCIILEHTNPPTSNNNINTINLNNNDHISCVDRYAKIKGFLLNGVNSKTSFTEENKQDKKCCVLEEEKDLVLTDKAFEKIKFEIETYEIVLFMKGNARKPSCGFSRQALDILKTLKVDTIRTVNVLEDQELRNGLKVYSNYPNFPQLYVRGKFVGGLEKISKMFSDGTLEKIIRE